MVVDSVVVLAGAGIRWASSVVEVVVVSVCRAGSVLLVTQPVVKREAARMRGANKC